MNQIGGDQRHIVLMQHRAHAQLAPPFWVGQLFVADGGEGRVLARHHHARADRQRQPLPIVTAQIRGHGPFDGWRIESLRQPAVGQLSRLVQADGDQDIRRRGFAFRGQALDEAVFDEQQFDGGATVAGEGRDGRRQQIGFPGCIDGDLVRMARCRTGAERRRQREQQTDDADGTSSCGWFHGLRTSPSPTPTPAARRPRQ